MASASDNETPATSAQRSIQSIDVGFRLIHVLEKATAALPLKTLAARADMQPAKAHLYLVSFIRLGLVVQDQASGHYGLGPYALQLGQAAIRQLDVPALAREPLSRLQKMFDLPAYLSIWGAGGPFSILKFDADLPTPLTIKVGFAFPLLGTATGRIFLAYMPQAITRKLAQEESALHPQLAARREDIVEGVLRDGLSISEGYLFRGFSAISAPVFDHAGQLAAAVTIIGAAADMDRTADGAMAKAVKDAGREISAGLGFQG